MKMNEIQDEIIYITKIQYIIGINYKFTIHYEDKLQNTLRNTFTKII